MRTFSGLCGLGVLAGASMRPVTSLGAEKTASVDSLNNNRGHAPPHKTNTLLRLFLGQDLASSKRLGHYTLFVITDFLCFTSVYIPYTHLPTFAEVSYLGI